MTPWDTRTNEKVTCLVSVSCAFVKREPLSSPVPTDFTRVIKGTVGACAIGSFVLRPTSKVIAKQLEVTHTQRRERHLSWKGCVSVSRVESGGGVRLARLRLYFLFPLTVCSTERVVQKVTCGVGVGEEASFPVGSTPLLESAQLLVLRYDTVAMQSLEGVGVCTSM